MPTLKVNFKLPAKATEFVKHFGVVGLKATAKVDGSSVTITSPDAKTHDFVKQMVGDLKIEAKMESVMKNFTAAITESSINNTDTNVVLFDGSSVSIDPDFANKFIKVHDNLSEDFGQGVLRCLVVENTESFEKTKAFVAKECK